MDREKHWHGPTLREHVFAACDNAMSNEYPINEWPAYAIVADMLYCDAGCEGLSPDELTPHVEAWLAARSQ